MENTQKQNQPQHSSSTPSSNHNNPPEQDQDQVSPETLQHFNNICLQATQLMNDYKNQSLALKQEIAGMVSIYQKNASPTEAVPVQKIISITQQYQQGMKQANKQYNHLAQELKKQQQERDTIMLQIKDCFDKLERMEVKIKAKKLKQQQEKANTLKQEPSKDQSQTLQKQQNQQNNN